MVLVLFLWVAPTSEYNILVSERPIKTNTRLKVFEKKPHKSDVVIIFHRKWSLEDEDVV